MDKTIEEVTEENIDRIIDEWHSRDITTHLHDYLGLTLEQYHHWIKTGKLT